MFWINSYSLSESLLEKETLDLKQIIQILGQRPFVAKQNFRDYLDTKEELDSHKEQPKSVLPAWFLFIKSHFCAILIFWIDFLTLMTSLFLLCTCCLRVSHSTASSTKFSCSCFRRDSTSVCCRNRDRYWSSSQSFSLDLVRSSSISEVSSFILLSWSRIIVW